MQLFYYISLLFFCYSFLGWLTETTYCALAQGHITNRGFLNGPLCPVYGFGALLVIFLLEPLAGNVPLLFVAGVVVTSILEYITGWLLEVFFHTRWWDYSQHRFNLHGRVCLLNSVLFGILSVFAVKILHPAVSGLISHLAPIAQIIVGTILLTLLAVDLFLSVRAALQLSGKLGALYETSHAINVRVQSELERRKLAFDEIREMDMHERMVTLFGKEEASSLTEKLEKLRSSRFMQRRILNAFPGMRSKKYPKQLEELKTAIVNWKSNRKNKKKPKQDL